MPERSQTSDYSSRQPQVSDTSSSNRHEDRQATSTITSSYSLKHPPGLESSGVPAAVKLSAELVLARQAIDEQEKEIRELKADNMTLVEDMRQVHVEWQAEIRKRHEAEMMVESLIQERDAAAAQQLTVNTFDSSLDRVSEGQLVGEVEALNNSISSLVMDVIERSSSVQDEQPTQEALDFVRNETLLVLATREGISGEDRALLVEAVLHRTIIRHLHRVLFQPQVAPDVPIAEDFEELYLKEISENGGSSSVLFYTPAE
jgi:hypothetical protein